MEDIQLTVDIERSGRSNSGLVWAGLYLRVGDRSFPDAGWTDFIVVVLSWWMRALLAIVRGNGERHEVMFMDGPFAVDLRALTAVQWQVSCVERRSRRTSRFQANVDSQQLLESAIKAGERALELCRDKDWWSKDADELEGSLYQLREEMRGQVWTLE